MGKFSLLESQVGVASHASCLGFELISTGKCARRSCSKIFGCLTCYYESQCTLCERGFHLAGSLCLLNVVCPADCESCTAPLSCSQCSPGFMFSQSNACVPAVCALAHCLTCPSGVCTECELGCFAYSNGTCGDSPKKCQPGEVLLSEHCFPRCSTVADCSVCLSGTTCDICSLGHVHMGQCFSEICSSQTHCLACATPGVCDLCEEGYELASAGTCTHSAGVPILVVPNCLLSNSEGFCWDCEVDYYIAEDGTCQQTLCANPPNCLLCAEPGLCDLCYVGFVRVNGLCVEGSKDALYWQVGHCEFPSSTGCLGCVPGYTLPNKGVCTLDSCSAIARCAECASACTLCEAGFELSEKGTCEIATGSTCLAFDSACRLCQYGLRLDTNNQCTSPSCSTLPHCLVCKLSCLCDVCEERYILHFADCIAAMENYPCLEQQCAGVCARCMAPYVLDENSQCFYGWFALPHCLKGTDTRVCILCEQGFFAGNNGLCHEATCTQAKNCLLCDVNLQCLVCKRGYAILEGQCAASSSTPFESAHTGLVCPSPFALTVSEKCVSTPSAHCRFVNYDGVCYSCYPPFSLYRGACVPRCSSLLGCLYCRYASQCDECVSGYQLMPDFTCFAKLCPIKDMCLRQCGYGMYFYPSYGCLTQSCLTIQNCVTCRYGSCDLCDHGFFITTEGTCQAKSCSTISHCLQCAQPSFCDACESNYYLDMFGGCTSLLGFFNNCLLQSSRTCAVCERRYVVVNKQCTNLAFEHCDVWDLSGCTVCEAGFSLSSGRCVGAGLAGQMCNARSCFSIANCLRCTYAWSCDECVVGYTRLQTGQCSVDSCFSRENCLACSNAGACDICMPGFTWDQYGTCLTDYSTSMDFCMGPNRSCGYCLQNYKLASNGECVRTSMRICLQFGDAGQCVRCEFGLTLSEFGSCIYPTATSIANCLLGSQSKCSVCASPYVSTGTACEMPSCQNFPHCVTCSNSKYYTCVSGFRISSVQCVPTCSTLLHCLQCSDPALCEECENGWSTTEAGKCAVYAPCPINCAVCTIGYCMECLWGYVLNSGNCEVKCGAHCSSCYS